MLKKILLGSILFSLFCFPFIAQDGEDVAVKSPFPIRSLCWNKDDKLFAFGEGNTIFIRSTDQYSIAHMLKFEGVSSVAFSREGSQELIMALSDKGLVSMWDYEKFEDPEMSVDYSEAAEVICPAFSADSNNIALSLGDSSILLYYKLRLTKQILKKRLEGHTEPAYFLAFSPDNEYLASVSSDGFLKVWNSRSGKMMHEYAVYQEAKIPCAWTNDSKRIVFASGEKELSVYSLEGELLGTILSEKRIVNLQCLRSKNSVAVLTDKNTIDFYDLGSMENYGYLPPKNVFDITSYAFSSDDVYLLEGHGDGTVVKLNVEKQMLAPGELPNKLVIMDDDDVDIQEKKDDSHDSEDDNKKEETIVLFKHEDFVSINFVPMILSSPYACSVGADAALKIGSLLTPFYFGLGLSFNVGFPSSPFSYEYAAGGTELNPPNIYAFDFYVPLGVRLVTGPKKFSVCLEFRSGVRGMCLWNGQTTNSAKGNDYFTALFGFDAIYYMGPVGVGIGVDFDTILLAKPKFIVGGKIPVPVVKSIKQSIRKAKIKKKEKERLYGSKKTGTGAVTESGKGGNNEGGK